MRHRESHFTANGTVHIRLLASKAKIALLLKYGHRQMRKIILCKSVDMSSSQKIKWSSINDVTDQYRSDGKIKCTSKHYASVSCTAPQMIPRSQMITDQNVF